MDKDETAYREGVELIAQYLIESEPLAQDILDALLQRWPDALTDWELEGFECLEYLERVRARCGYPQFIRAEETSEREAHIELWSHVPLYRRKPKGQT